MPKLVRNTFRVFPMDLVLSANNAIPTIAKTHPTTTEIFTPYSPPCVPICSFESHPTDSLMSKDSELCISWLVGLARVNHHSDTGAHF